jgi:molybdopterin synthase catalytic subunit
MIATKTIGELVTAVLAKRDEIDEIKHQSDKAMIELESLEEELSEQMNEQGLQSVKSTDGRLIYKSRDLFVNVAAANRSAVVEACRDLGLDELIKTEVPTSSLKARIREWMGDLGDREQIPEPLRPLIAVHESYSIRVRKS